MAPRGFAPELRRELLRRFGLESSLRPEARESRVETTVASLAEALPLVCELRTANRVLVALADGEVRPGEAGLEDLEELTHAAALSPWLSETASFAVRCSRRGEHAFSSQEAAARAGAAVIDLARSSRGFRPAVDLEDPDLVLRLAVLDRHALLAVELSGPRSLHRRGYMARPHRAALKTTVAAALLDRAGWRPGEDLLDPMCGGGTILLEAGLEAAGVPAAWLRRERLGFRRLPPFRELDWEPRLEERAAKADPGRVTGLVGADISARTLEDARTNEERAGLAGRIRWIRSPIGALPRELEGRTFSRIVVNPPYGVRMGTRREVETTHRRLLRAVASLLRAGGRCSLVTTRLNLVYALAEAYGLRASCRTVYLGDLKGGAFVLEAPP
jgi:tRNA (guanine6-N2)-methyltransferase